MPRARPKVPSTLRGLRRWLVSIGLAIVLVACVLGAVVATLIRQAPDWWRTSDPDDPETIIAGEEVENGVLNVMYAAREQPQEQWTVTLRAADANAWLSTRLQSWLASSDPEFEWPHGVRDLQVEFDENLIYVGARVETEARSQILSATLRPTMHEDGSLWVHAQAITVGRLPVPAEWVLNRTGAGDLVPSRARESPELRRVLDALRGICALEEEPVVDLGDGRRVRLLRLAAQRGRLIVQCRTEFED